MNKIEQKELQKFINSIYRIEWHRRNGIEEGWNACKQEVLKILEKDLQNCDLSTDSCDSRYIDKIKEL